MPINAIQINVGGYYYAGANCEQLRKVTKIVKDDKGRNRIVYESKSAKIAKRQFVPTATLANPALEATFASDCCSELSASEIQKLRQDNIILANE
ncbi:hypothetical protein [Vibrio diabolicus]|uniref:hypothetical protein n=1 Tax=Vibrio diabolicus TaxID=50719 RepID=UPI0038CD9BC1